MKNTHELTILSFSLPEEYEDPIGALLDKWNHIGWVVEQLPDSSNVCFKAYFSFLPNVHEISSELNRCCNDLMELGFEQCILRVDVSTMQEEDWKIYWRRNFYSFSIGKKLFIKPVWEPDPLLAAEKRIVTIEPGMAFGTGLHPTTRYCLELLDDYAGCYESVVDMGCGSGILSIAAAKLGARHVDGFDNDPQAVAYAHNLSMLNGTAECITFSCIDLSKYIPPCRYDMVLVNIYAEVLIAGADKIISALAPSGLLALTGILNQKLPSVRDAFNKRGLIERSFKSETEWSGILFSF
ncbi:50S ribosomal protein L11 methyltransferase [bacterium]|nr:50S ribosomal protein L11 methyltransferase [bacterium]MCP5462653.1 50S ribosomal protein L11 methyltransferase [bacterium]